MKMRLLQAVLLMVLLSGCNANLASSLKTVLSSGSIQILPDFINDIRYSASKTLANTFETCLTLDGKALWEENVTSNELREHLTQNTRIMIDGNEIAQNQLRFWGLSIALPVYGENGELLGQYLGGIGICFSVEGLNQDHELRITIVSPQGRIHTYTWYKRFVS